jgi:hypothetical protein
MDVKGMLKGLADAAQGFIITTIAGYKSLLEYRKIQKLSKVKVIFLTSDYGIYGIHEELDGLVNNEEDTLIIEGFDRIFLGDEKRGIITYRDTQGMDYVFISDGNHQVLDVNLLKGLFKLKDEKIGVKDLTKVSQLTEKQKELLTKLNDLHIRDFGITLDLNALDDHVKAKDFTVWAKKVMNHGFYKSLTKFPAKMILLIAFVGFFLGTTLEFGFLFVVVMLYLFAKLLIH